MTTGQNPWGTLTHDTILNSLEKTVQLPLGNLCLRRNSYINRVYEIEATATKERFIAKYYRPQRWTPAMITTEHSFVQELAQADIPVIPAIHTGIYENITYAIYPKKGGRALDEFDQTAWETIGRILAKMHLVGENHTAANRVRWTPDAITKQQIQDLLPHIPESHKQSFARMAAMFIERTQDLFKDIPLILIHGDCHRGNLIHRPGEGVSIVDFDDICVGPALQDLWMLLPGSPDDCPQELEWFISGYETFRDFPYAELKLVPALRAMRIIHFAAWCALQSQDIDFHDHFPEWGSVPYWTGIIRELQEIIETL